MTPTFDGNSIFGLFASIRVLDNPREVQYNAYPGLNGVESVDLGGRGRFSEATGVLFGSGISGLLAAESTFRQFKDSGLVYVLIDTLGGIWFNVKLESFEPMGQVQSDADGTCYRRYTARFRHLT